MHWAFSLTHAIEAWAPSLVEIYLMLRRHVCVGTVFLSVHGALQSIEQRDGVLLKGTFGDGVWTDDQNHAGCQQLKLQEWWV